MYIEIGEDTSLAIEQRSAATRFGLDTLEIARDESLKKIIGIRPTDNDGF